MKTILQYLNKKKLKAWQVTQTKQISNEIYLVSNAIETVRCTNVTKYHVEVHQNSKKDGCIGESSTRFETIPGKWKQLIDDAIEYSKLITNPAYNFSPTWSPKHQDVIINNKNLIADPEVQKSDQNTLVSLAEQVRSLSPKELYNCTVASCEIFLKYFIHKKFNSRGLELSFPSSTVSMDFVLLSPDKKSEINHYSTQRYIKQYNIKDIFSQEAKHLSVAHQAALPPTKEMSVILQGEALDNLFDYFVEQATGNAIYFKYSTLELGKSVYANQQDALENLTIYTDPYIPRGLNSGFCDSTGYPLKKLTLIENGRLKNYSIDGKIAQLLNQNRTSAASNICVETDKQSYEDFFTENNILEVFQFSSFHPNPITGAFSGEIRIGYLYGSKGKLPIKGGSVSGISQRAFLEAYYSKEKIARSSYLGPKAVFFKKLAVSGA